MNFYLIKKFRLPLEMIGDLPAWKMLWICVSLLMASGSAFSSESGEPEPTAKEKPFFVVPLLTSNPKMSTSVGAVAGYLHQFDSESTPSMFSLSGTYSDSDSAFAALFAQMFFDRGQQQLNVALVNGRVNNDYDDFLGSGLPAQTTDKVHMVGGRYSYRVGPHWFLGIQAMASNYVIEAEGAVEQALETIGLTGVDSVGLGLAAELDSRDHKRNPKSGKHLIFGNYAYREDFGGSDDYDVYRANFASYHSLAERYVLAWQLSGRWTEQAPISGYSSIALRGYVRGMQLAPNSTHFAIDNRIRLKGRFGLTIYGGVACLYDEMDDCSDSSNVYPSFGGGASFMVREQAGVVLRAEYIVGKEGSDGFYVTLNNPF